MCKGRIPLPLTEKHWAPAGWRNELNSNVFNDSRTMQDDTRAIARYISERHEVNGDKTHSVGTDFIIGTAKYHLKVPESTARKIMKEMIKPDALCRGRIYGISMRR